MFTIRRLAFVLTFGVVLMGSAAVLPAAAQTYVGVPPPQVGSSDSGGTASVVAQSQSSQSGDRAVRGLAFTGGDLIGLLLLAGTCTGVGLVICRVARRPAA